MKALTILHLQNSRYVFTEHNYKCDLRFMLWLSGQAIENNQSSVTTVPNMSDMASI